MPGKPKWKKRNLGKVTVARLDLREYLGVGTAPPPTPLITRSVKKSIDLEGYCKPAVNTELEKALLSGNPNQPSAWKLKVAAAQVTYDYVTTVYPTMFYKTPGQAEAFWTSWSNVENKTTSVAGEGDKALNVSLVSWENGGGGQ